MLASRLVVVMVPGCVLLGAGVASAQWTSDPAAQLIVAEKAGDQNQPKVRAIPGGGYYVSWLSTQGTGWDTWLQRLNSNGQEQWAHNGINVADTNFSSTQDYGLDVDSQGNAIIAFRDDSTGITQIAIQKVSPAGVLLFGAHGIPVSNSPGGTDSVGTPNVVVASDGNYVVGYARQPTTAAATSRAWFQKVDPSGNLLWGSGVMIAPATNGYVVGPMIASDNGHVIAVLATFGPFTANRRLHAQKLDSATGAQMWNAGTPVVVQTANQLQVGNFGTAVSDGANGAVIAWYDTPNAAFQCRVQRVDSAGNLLWTSGGEVAATTAGQMRAEPSLAFDAATGETYLFYVEQNTSQSMRGCSGQKFNSAGVRQWTDNGFTVTPLQANGIIPSFTRTVISPGGGGGGGAIVSFFEGTNPSASTGVVKASRITAAGAFAWASQVVTVNSNGGAAKTRQEAVAGPGGSSILVYGDATSGSLDILSSRVNADGTVGNPPCPADADGNGQITPADVAAFVNRWFTSLNNADLTGDFDGNGQVNPADVAAFVTIWFAALSGGC